MPVHLYGQPADLDPLQALGLPVVEDAAHAAESEYRGRKIGGSPTRRASRSTRRSRSPPARAGSSTNRRRRRRGVDALTIMRRGHGSLYDIAVPGYKANLSDVLAAIALCQLDKVERTGARLRRSSSTTRPSPELDGIEPSRATRATRTRTTCTSSGRRGAAGATRDEYRARSPRRTSGRASTSCRCTS
jgi:dTDP-4-amino-4,6-dideoxygalactose transaminase